MFNNGWDKAPARLRKDLASTESEARRIASSIDQLRKCMEAAKVSAIHYYLEQQRKTLACSRGFSALRKSRVEKHYVLLLALGGFALGGIVSQNLASAIAAGLTGVESLARKLGETRWCVLLGHKIRVVAQDETRPRANWVTLEDLTAALDRLMRKALAGAKLGSLDDIIFGLGKRKRLTPRQSRGLFN